MKITPKVFSKKIKRSRDLLFSPTVKAYSSGGESHHENQINKACEVIRNYDSERDKKAVSKIATKHLSSLIGSLARQKGAYENFVENNLYSETGSNFIYKTQVCVIDGVPVGFISYYVAKKFLASLIPYDFDSSARIKFLAVDEKYQGNGIGGKLITEAIKDCKEAGAGSISVVTVPLEKEKTINFYKKHGFRYITVIYSGLTPSHGGNTIWRKSLEEASPYQDEYDDSLSDLADIFTQMSLGNDD